MKLPTHQLTHAFQQKAGVYKEIADSLRKDRLTFRTSIVILMGSSAYQMETAAGELAKELGKQLHKVKLSAITTKYIGETEKNLNAIFNSAASMGWILFFDEADALFGKRTHVKDAHDRYANLETNYLLRKIEQHRGIIILTTNHVSQLPMKISRIRKTIIKFPPFA